MRLPVLGAVAALAAGCAAVGPDYVKPEVELPPGWLDAERRELDTTPAELAGWWRVLNDPVLDALIDQAVANNNNLRIAGLRVLEAQARLGIATGSRYPQVQVATGDVTAPHLHFEVWRWGRPVDPVPVLGGLPGD